MAIESKHVVKFKERQIKNGESVLAYSVGYIGEMMGKGGKAQQNGVLIVTNERAVFYRKGLMSEVVEAIPLNAINSIERVAGLIKHTLSLHGSGNKIVFKSIEKKESDIVANKIEELQSKSIADTNTSVTINNDSEDALEKIKKLAELKELGAITESEFNEKKSKLLSEI